MCVSLAYTNLVCYSSTFGATNVAKLIKTWSECFDEWKKITLRICSLLHAYDTLLSAVGSVCRSLSRLGTNLTHVYEFGDPGSIASLGQLVGTRCLLLERKYAPNPRKSGPSRIGGANSPTCYCGGLTLLYDEKKMSLLFWLRGLLIFIHMEQYILSLYRQYRPRNLRYVGDRACLVLLFMGIVSACSDCTWTS